MIGTTTTYSKTYINYGRYDATSTNSCSWGDEWGYYVEWIDIKAEAKENIKLVGVLYSWMGLEYYWLLKLVIGQPLPEHPLEPWHPPEQVNSVCL